MTGRPGAGDLASVRYREGSDDIDLDAAIDQLVEHPAPENDNIIVRERVRTRRSVVLLADVSGSMHGERVRTAAAGGHAADAVSRDCPGLASCWTSPASTTPTWLATGPGWAAAGSGSPALTMTSRPP
jgi:hypothetical protein